MNVIFGKPLNREVPLIRGESATLPIRVGKHFIIVYPGDNEYFRFIRTSTVMEILYQDEFLMVFNTRNSTYSVELT